MKPETTLLPEQMNNFSINVVNNFEGCAEAIVFLKRIYGERSTDLRTTRSDFVALVKARKENWVINFLLNTITKKYRAQFIANLVSENLYLMENEETKAVIIEAMTLVQDYAQKPSKSLLSKINKLHKYLYEKRKVIKSTLQGFDINSDPDLFNSLQSTSQFLKAVVYFLENVNNKMTRHSVSFCQSLAEAIQWKFMGQAHSDYFFMSMQSFSFALIDFVGYFVDTEKKDQEND